MMLARVIGSVVSTLKHDAYRNRTLLLVKFMNPDGTLTKKTTIAVDYVGAGAGEVVLIGAAPGLAKSVFGVKVAPIAHLVMGIVDRVDVGEKSTDYA